MPLIDVRCRSCGTIAEVMRPLSEYPRTPRCGACGEATEQIHLPQRYVPFTPYFDYGLGEEVTSLGHRWQLMKQHHLDYRDHPSKGDLSARRDRCEAQRREARMSDGR